MKVLVAIADDYCQNQVLTYLKARKWNQETIFRLLHVIDKDGASDLPAIRKHERDGVAFLEKFVGKLSASNPGIKIEKSMVEGDPCEQILRAAREWKADLIIIGAHGRRGLERLMLGSVSQTVTNESTCSVTVVKLTKATLDLDLTEADQPQQICSINLSECK